MTTKFTALPHHVHFLYASLNNHGHLAAGMTETVRTVKELQKNIEEHDRTKEEHDMML
jgi:hypothetical protein